MSGERTSARLAAAVAAFAIAAATRSTVRAAAGRSEQQGAETTRTVWDGVYTEEQSKRGRVLYLDNCARCHSETLAGGESATALVGETFDSGWNGLTVADLFERTRVSMPQDKPGSMSRQQVADVLAYIFDANKFPRGEKELDRNPTALKAIRLVMPKPE